MTEMEWMNHEDPRAMLSHVRGVASNRQLGLFAREVCWHSWYPITGESHQAVEAVEKHADGLASTTWDAAWGATWYALHDADKKYQATLLRDIMGNPFRPVVMDPSWLTWRDRLIPQMAQNIYDERRFEDLPILADALEEAGCNNMDILMHLRSYELCPGCLGTGLIDYWLADGQCDVCLFSVERVDGCSIKYYPGCGFIRLRGSHGIGCWALSLAMEKLSGDSGSTSEADL